MIRWVRWVRNQSSGSSGRHRRAPPGRGRRQPDPDPASAPGPVLDIGAAYGVATIPALKNGAHVIANYLEEKHLQILKNKVPLSYLSHLDLKSGRMPNELDIEKNSLGAVLTSRVLSFVLPEELELSFKKIFRWLKSGGEFFFLGGTTLSSLSE